MDLNDTEEQAAFRASVQSLETEILGRYRQDSYDLGSPLSWRADRKSEHPDAVACADEWARRSRKRSWVEPRWPED
jgi:hypothetical protein